MAKRKRNRLFYNCIWALIFALLLALPSLGLMELSALALEQEPRCGQAEHTHTEECYYRDMLVCGQKAHSHSENCYLVLLSDNDINWLLTTVEDTEEKSLETVIDSAMVQALTLNPNLMSANSQQIQLTADSVSQLNAVISENHIEPAVVLNENLSDNYLSYIPPQAEPEEGKAEEEPTASYESTLAPETSSPTEAAGTTGTAGTTQSPETTTPPETTETTTPLETTEATTPPETTEATTPPETTETTTPPETTEATAPPETTETTAPPETTETTAPPETTEATAPPETTEATPPPETTEATAPPETTETTGPPETTETTGPPETTETTGPPEPTFLWETGLDTPVLAENAAGNGQIALYIYLDDYWTCIRVLNMEQAPTAHGMHYSIRLRDLRDACQETLVLDENTPLERVLYYAPQSPAEGIGGIAKAEDEVLDFGADGTVRHFYLTHTNTDTENSLLYVPVFFHSVTLDYTAVKQSPEREVYYVQTGADLATVCTEDYLWQNEQGEAVSGLDPVTGDLLLYALPGASAVPEATEPDSTTGQSGSDTNASAFAVPSSGAADDGDYGAAPAAVGGTPSTGTRAINFYIRLDGATTFINSASLTYNNSNSQQQRKEYCSYATAVNAYTSGTGIVTGLTTGNLGSSYYFRHSTGSTAFNTSAAYSNGNVYFANSNDAQYAMLSVRNGNTYSPVNFYTVTLDYSAVNGTDQVQYVESGLDSTFTLSDEYVWYSDAEGTVLASAENLENISRTVTLYARPGNRTVTFVSNGGSEVQPQTVRRGSTAVEPEDPVKDGFVFGGWYADEGLTGLYDFSTPVTENITLYARWLEACTVSWVDTEGNPLEEPQIVGAGTSLTLPEGYSWTAPDGQTYPGGHTPTITQDTEFVGILNTYTVTCYSDGSIYAVLDNIPHGSVIELPQDPSFSGHRFMGWYRDEAYSQAFYRDTPITGNWNLYARWGFDITLNYLDMQGELKKQDVLSRTSGDTVTLPEHYTWVDPGTDPDDPSDDILYPGGGTVTVLHMLTLTGIPDTYSVSFVDTAGNPLAEGITLEYGGSFFFPDVPDGCVWEGSDGSHYIGGDYFDAVTADLTFTAREVSLTIHYDVNFPNDAADDVDEVPTLYGTDSATASDSISGGSSVTIRSLTSNTARDEVSSSNRESVTYFFRGWSVEGEETLISADSVLPWSVLSRYADEDGNVYLNGQWEDGVNYNSVSFFVRIDSVASDTEGNIGGHPVEDYTPEIFHTHLGGVTSTDASALDALEIADTTADNSYTADQQIRALYGERAEGIWMYEFPHDNDIFAYLRNYLEENPTRRLTVDDIPVETDELNSTHYAIRWYVFKLESGSWHVDGRLVRREGQFNVYKDFEGEEAAIIQAESGFYILAQNGTQDVSGTFTPYSPSDTDFKQYLLVLDQATGNALAGSYPNATVELVEESDTAAHTYFWQIRGIKLGENWQVTEFPRTIDGYSHYAEYSVYDSDGELTAIAEYGTRAKATGKIFALDEDPDQGVTIEYTNYYLDSQAILLKKEDAATGSGIGGAGFNFLQKDNILSFAPNDNGSYSQDPNAGNTDILTGANGFVTIDGFSYQYGADSNEGSRGKILIQESIVPEGYGWAATIELGLDSNDNVYIAGVTTVDGEEVPQSRWEDYVELPRNDVLILKNHVTELTSVTARKAWSTNTPADSVQVVLQANGQNAANTFPGLKNAQVVLNADNGWTYTWEDLPRYAGGQLVQWSIKEVVVGNAPTLSDGVSFANWIPVYSTGTGTDLDGDGDMDNWSYTVTNYSKSPKLILTKVGVENEGLPGAVFTLEQVELGSGGWQKVSGSTTVSQTTDANGVLTFENLVGTYIYRLTEVKAPAGHIILIEPLVFTVDGDGNIRKLDETGAPVPITSQFLSHDSPYNLMVRNLVTVELPETGGCGTTVYWLCGMALIFTALLLYKLPKRKEDCISS